MTEDLSLKTAIANHIKYVLELFEFNLSHAADVLEISKYKVYTFARDNKLMPPNEKREAISAKARATRQMNQELKRKKMEG